MENINLTINGNKVVTTKGKTILEVVNAHNLDHIPTLCHDERIEPYGSCFLCAVEVEGMNKLVPACSTPVNEGMIIHTNNEKVHASRKAVLELLMSNHYADCIGPCINNCPASVDAQGYIALIARGKNEEALKLIKKSNPLPLSIGRVCVRNCEDACRRCYVDDPVAINFLKRYVADIDNTKWTPDLKSRNGKRVAIIGGGPAGLTCAYYLAIEGYSPVIYDKLPHLGGMLRYGIPEYRLPKAILDAEIKSITNLGVEVHTKIEMGKDITVESLRNSGYDAIYLSVGAHKASSMGLAGENDILGIYRGIDFLREVTINGAPKLTGTVVIVGGGNTAIDAARTSLRCGADKVKIVYRRSIKEMPAHPVEIEAAQEEGVEILFLTNPKSIVSTYDGKLKGIECLKMELVEAAPGERPKPVPVEGSEFIVECDYLVGAIGQQIDTSFVSGDKDCQLERWGTVKVNPDTFETSIPGVFAGGDVVSGALTAVNAIGHGKKAARAIDSFLKTGKATKANGKFYSFKNRFNDLSESEFSQFRKQDREKMPEIPLNERNNFKEIELGLYNEQVVNEVMRCLECGCSEYYDCKLRQYSDEYQVDITDYLGDVRKFKVDKRHPFIALDPNKCINCGLCVRTCSEILSVSALGFVNRGFKSVVKPAMEKPLLETNCITCGNCIDVCPTGAISEKYPFKVLGTLPKTDHQSVCNFCSIGCNINYKVIDDSIFYVSNSTKEIMDSKNNGYLCVKGRFGYRMLLENNRVKFTAMKTGNSLKEVNLEEAIAHTVSKVKEITAKYGKDSVAIFASPKMTNEDLYLLQKFARVGLKTNNISSLSNLLYGAELDATANSTHEAIVSSMPIDEIKNTDVIIVINADLVEDNLIMELKIKEARKKGAKLILISSSETELNKFADLWLDTRKGSNTVLINGFIKESLTQDSDLFNQLNNMVSHYTPETVIEFTGVDEGKYRKALNLIKDNKTNISFVYNLDSLKEKSKNDLNAIYNFMSATSRINRDNNGIIILRDFANSVGLRDMGVSPNYLPGYVKHNESGEIKRIGDIWGLNLEEVFKPTNILDRFSAGKIKAVLLFGEDPLSDIENLKYFNDIEFLMVLDAYNTVTATQADVVIPAASFIEESGTYTSCDTKIQKVVPVINNKNNFENWEIILKLAAGFDYHFNYVSSDAIFEEVLIVNRVYTGCKAGEYWNKNKKNGPLVRAQKFVPYNYEIDVTASVASRPSIHYSDNYYIREIKNRLVVA